MTHLSLSAGTVPSKLGDDEVHLWQVQLDAPALQQTCWEDPLSPDELERARRFHFPRDARRFTTTRGMLRTLLAEYLGARPKEISFEYGPKGKPALAGKHASSGLHFNVSHSEERAFIGMARRNLGVDIEHVRDDVRVDEIAQRFFSVAERKALFSLTPEQRARAFFDCWTRKEAFIKAKGDGLFLQLDEFDVSVVPDEPARLLATRPDLEEVKRWQMSATDVGPEYAAAVTVEAGQLELSYWTSALLGSA